jgi:hypothetical protein
MSRISRLDRSQVTHVMAAYNNTTFAQHGNTPNIFYVMEPAKPGEGGCTA